MATRSRRVQRTSEIWPGFVDALSTLLMVIIFLLVAFMLAQYFLTVALSGRDEALERLNLQVSELAELLSLEQKTTADLRLGLEQLTTERDALDLRLEEATALVASLEADAEALRAALTEAKETTQADRETLEVTLAELAGLRQDIAALRAVRADLEGQVQLLATALDKSNKRLAELDAESGALRDRATLAEKEVEDREIRLNELRLALKQSDEDLAKEHKLTAASRAQIDLLNQQILALRQQLERIGRALEVARKKAADQKVVIADLGRKLNVALASKVEELQRYRSEFFGRLREVLGTRPGIRIEGDRFVFQSEVLFSSGSAKLEQRGKVQMAHLAATLLDIARQIPDDLKWVLRVDGHTDTVPIKTPQFASNWELSTARAISVVRFLIESGVPPERLAAAGFGEFQPIDRRGDEIAFRRNRRIELKLTTR